MAVIETETEWSIDLILSATTGGGLFIPGGSAHYQPIINMMAVQSTESASNRRGLTQTEFYATRMPRGKEHRRDLGSRSYQ